MGTDALTWRQLGVHVAQSARDPQSALFRHVAGDWAPWDSTRLTNILTAKAIYTLEVANWQRGADEKEAKNPKHFPEPILLPGQVREERPSKADERVIGGGASMWIDTTTGVVVADKQGAVTGG